MSNINNRQVMIRCLTLIERTQRETVGLLAVLEFAGNLYGEKFSVAIGNVERGSEQLTTAHYLLRKSLREIEEELEDE